MYNNVDIRDGCYGVILYNTDGDEIGFSEKGKEVTLEQVAQSIENGDVIWRVSFDYLGSRKHYELPRNRIAEKKLVAELQGKGADVTARTFNVFVDSMRLQEEYIAPKINMFRGLGWIIWEADGQLELAYRCWKLFGSHKAKYLGNLCLTPQGSFDEWCAMVKTDVLGRPPLETILLAALASPIVGLLGLYSTAELPILHINYRSGRGKSTACKLAASVAGAPFEGKKNVYDKRSGQMKAVSSVYGTWGSTAKATISSLAGNRGVVVVLNELGKFVGNDMSSVVFNMSEGSDIKRMNTQLETILVEGFSTVIISCGEMSLIDRCKTKLEGLRYRVMELAVPMTEDADHARRIHRGCKENNGFAAPMIAKYIIENGGYDMVASLYEETLRDLTASAPEGIPDRFIEKFPTYFVMAAKLAKESMGLDFDVDSVVGFCYDCWRASAEEDGEVDRSFEDVISECRTYQHNFYTQGSQNDPLELWGTIAYPRRIEGNKVVAVEYGIRRGCLKEILNKYGHPNLKTCVDIWKASGVLDCEAGHNTRSRVINTKGDKERLFVLKIIEDAPEKTQSKIVRKSRLRKFLTIDDESEQKVDAQEETANE